MIDYVRITEELDEACDDISDYAETMDETDFDKKWYENRWGIRELVAFHTYWLGKLAGGIERINRGEQPTPEQTNWNEIQDAEAVITEHVKGKTKEEVVFEFEQAVDKLVDVVGSYADGESPEHISIGETMQRGLQKLQQHNDMIRGWVESKAV